MRRPLAASKRQNPPMPTLPARAIAIAILASCRGPASSPAPTSDNPEGEQALSDFQSGKLRPSVGPLSYILGKTLGPCVALPADRPESLFMDYQLRPSGDVIGPILHKRFAIGEQECEVLWSALHLGTPEVACTLLTADAYDLIYRRVLALTPSNIQATRIEDPHQPIHRGGYTMSWHWDAHHCEISDASDSEVLDADTSRFQEMLQELRGVCLAGKHEDCP